ncbi:MAG: hypothetical protein NTW19_09180 [Planctomycetota bacterium]|nr:hypothetical protein [Planctomycetota bacterium]
MTHDHTKTLVRLSTAALLLALVPLARAQNALDNNLQVGTGGLNGAQAPIDYNARNNIVTGNVSGLGSFHGNVGYRAPGEFSGSTASDSTFRFNAQSYPTAQGIRPLNQTPSISVFRSEAPTSVGQLGQITASTPLIIPRSAVPGILGNEQPGLRYNGTSITSGVLGTVQQSQGRMLELSATPLLGLRVDEARPAADAQTPNPARPATDDPRNPNNRTDSNAPPTPDDGTSPRGNDPASTRSIGQFAPSLTLGEQIQNQLAAGKPVDAGLGLDQAIARMQASLFSPLGSASAAPGEDAYVDLLQRIQRNRDLAAGKPVEPLPPVATPPTTPPADGSQPPVKPTGFDTTGPQPVSPGSNELAAALPAPAPQELETARLARVNALRAARGLPAETSATPNPAAQPAPDNAPIPGRLGDLVGALNYNLPPMPTLAGKRDDRVNKLLRDAETDMATARYFDAEAKYRQAQSAGPDQPLATVGMIHAQLGAGLVRSASLNLRTLLERHPEIIATRYDARLLPRADRLERARKDLQEMTRTTGRAEPPMLLAYLGYQVNSPAVTRLALDQAQAIAPTDPLLVLLRRIWLADKPAAAGAAGAAGAPTTAPAPSGMNK